MDLLENPDKLDTHHSNCDWKLFVVWIRSMGVKATFGKISVRH